MALDNVLKHLGVAKPSPILIDKEPELIKKRRGRPAGSKNKKMKPEISIRQPLLSKSKCK